MISSEETPLNERQSLDLIQTMIRQAQNRFSDDGSQYLLWGWLVLIASLLHYALLRTTYADYGPLAWLLMPMGGVGAFLLGRRSAQRQTRTHLDRVMTFLWSAVGAAIGLTFAITFGQAHYQVTYPILLVLYGVGLFTSGGLLRFRPLQFGGGACWGLAMACTQVSFENQLLCLAAGVLVGYIVPGFVLRARFQQQQQQPTSLSTDAPRAV